jgi:hypothetical protein
MNLEKFILTSLTNGLTTNQIVQELKDKGILKTRKNINNIITAMREKGIEIPFLKSLKVTRTNKRIKTVSKKDNSTLVKNNITTKFIAVISSNKNILRNLISKI